MAGCATITSKTGNVAVLRDVDRPAIEARVVSYFRKTANIPLDTRAELSRLAPSTIPGWLDGRLEFTRGTHSEAVDFLISTDGRYLLRGEVADLTIDPAQANLAKISLRGQPVRGDPNAPVTVIEFSDFQCPYCARASKSIGAALLASYPGKVKLVHKNLPLSQIHPWAEAAAIAGECALQQSNDAFWKLYDDLFKQQKQITNKNLKDTAERVVKQAGGDLKQFSECFTARATISAIQADMGEAAALGVNSTPTFFVNGRKIAGAQPIEGFKSVIDEELSRQ